MTDIIDIDDSRLPQNYGTEIVGPFPGGRYFLTHNGYKIPHIELRKEDEGARFEWMLLIDERLGHLVNTQEIYHWAPALANAMAVSAGYSCFGENCLPVNPFKVGISRIDYDENDPPEGGDAA